MSIPQVFLTSGTSWTVPAGVYTLQKVGPIGGGGGGAIGGNGGAGAPMPLCIIVTSNTIAYQIGQWVWSDDGGNGANGLIVITYDGATTINNAGLGKVKIGF